MKNHKNIIISIIISVVLIIIILYLFPSIYFAEDPPEKWWNALSIVVAINFSVIALSVTILLRERESKEKIKKIEQDLEKTSENVNEKYKNTINIISNILDVQNASEIQSRSIWNSVERNIDNIDDIDILKSLTLRTWSTLAWKQGFLDVSLKLREKAYNLDKDNFRNRVMLCSILTQEKKPDVTRIENILDNTNLKSDDITDENIDHYYNIKGNFYKKTGEFQKAAESFNKALNLNVQTWSFKGYIISLIMQEDIDNEFIKEELERIVNIPDTKWFDDTVLNQKVFRLFINAVIDKSERKKFYNYLTPLKISELLNKYNNEYVKLEMFNFYSQITKKYKDEKLNILYLTFYKLLGVYDEQADIELMKQPVKDKINQSIITAHNN